MSRFVLTAQLQLQAPTNVAQVVSQIQSQLNGVSVNVQVQGAPQAQRQIQQIAAQTNQAASAAERMGKAFAVSVRRFAAFSIATRAVGLFTSTLSDAVQTAIDFERQMVKVSQVTGDSLVKLRGLTKTITGLATGLGVSSGSLLEVSTVLLQAGLSAKDTEVALKSLAKAALAPNFDSITETAEGAIAILAQFQKGVGALEGQLGSINAVAGAFAVEAGDLIDVIRRTGGVFKSSGGSLNELLALFTSVRATTRESAESIGTGLRTIFTRIQRPKTIEYLKQFGVELVDLEGKFVGPFEAVKRLSAALSGLGEGDITFIRIAEELGGFRQIGKVLPLLQQFSTAQAALNVATKAGNSLAQDAATAQQALAIRIIKVKEEFLALVRGITETSTFQVMANTALSLASALLKISEAIKPLLPLLASLAALKIARGFGTFVGSVAGGLQSSRTFNQGGKVHKFARGGMVPGSGNRDTVPAMLQPGEFVIRKSSVKRLGAGNLAAMNENKYEAGGVVRQSKHLYGSLPPRGMTKATANMTLEEAIASGKLSRQQLSKGYGKEAIDQVLGTAASANASKERSKTRKRKSSKIPTDDALKSKYPGGVFRTIPGAIGGFFLTPESGTDSPYVLSSPYPFDLNGQKAAIAPGSTISNFVPYRTDIKKNAALNKIIDSSARGGLRLGVKKALPKVNAFLDMPQINFDENTLNDAANAIAQDKQVYSTVGGYLFEGIIQGITGSKLLGGRESFDFPNVANNKAKLAAMFTTDISSLTPLIKADAKRSKTSKTNKSIIDKLRQDIQKNNLDGVIRLASGGIAKAPLIDDIVNASGTMMPRPSSAIASLIRAGGGAIDIDRTIKRTIGDKAYGMAKTSGQQSAALDKYFRDPKARLRDVTSAPLTVFGKELQAAIKSGQLQPGKLSILSKSQRVPGVAEYLSQLFGIPLANMIFTQGGSKQPAMDALRTKGPRSTRVARFATGGNVGTDTVPALLTPGEFVINRASAQKIGYSSLHRMNKVGKYAKGGVVRRFAEGGVASPVMSSGGDPFISDRALSLQAASLKKQSEAINNNTRSVDQSTQAQGQQKRSIKEVVQSNKFFALSMSTSLLQGFLPALDENAGSLTKLSHSMLGLITTVTSVGFALEALNVQLSGGQILDFLSGKGLTRVAAGARAGTSNIGKAVGGNFGKTISDFAPAVGRATQSALKFAGPMLAAVTSIYAFNSAMSAFFDRTAEINKAIEKGDVEKAGRAARGQSNLENANASRMGLGTVGAVIGSYFLGPGFGTVVGAAVGTAIGTIGSVFTEKLGILFGGNTLASTVALAEAQAQLAKTNKAFEQGEKDATKALKDLQEGTISVEEAMRKIAPVAAEAAATQAQSNKAIIENNKNKSGTFSGIGRYVAATATLGYVDTGAERNAKIDQRNQEEARKNLDAQRKAFDIQGGIRNERIRTGILSGQSESAVIGSDVAALQRQQAQFTALSDKAKKSGDTETASVFEEQAKLAGEQAQQLKDSFANLSKEIEIAKKKFEAINLGFRSVTANSEAAALRLNNFVSNLEVGSVPAQQAVATLEASITKAGQAISANEVNGALDEVSGVFRQFGASEQEIAKFRENLSAVATVQRSFPTIFENMKSQIKSGGFRGMSSENIGKMFKDQVSAQLESSGVGEEVRNRILDSMGDVKIGPEIIAAIDRGDYSALDEYLKDAGEEAQKVMKEVVDNYAKIHQQLIELTKRRDRKSVV